MPDQIAVTLGQSAPVEGSDTWATWVQWIDDAELAIRVGLIRRGVEGGLDALDQDVLAFVVREAVALKVKRPDSATQVDVAVDDAKVSRRYESSTGQVTILPEWWGMLLLGVSGDGRMFQIDMVPSSAAIQSGPDVWLGWVAP